MFRKKSVNIQFEKVNARTIIQELGIENKPFLVFLHTHERHDCVCKWLN